MNSAAPTTIRIDVFTVPTLAGKPNPQQVCRGISTGVGPLQATRVDVDRACGQVQAGEFEEDGSASQADAILVDLLGVGRIHFGRLGDTPAATNGFAGGPGPSAPAQRRAYRFLGGHDLRQSVWTLCRRAQQGLIIIGAPDGFDPLISTT
jgi:hypothetical protein